MALQFLEIQRREIPRGNASGRIFKDSCESAALKGGTLCGAKKVLNWIVYGLLVGFVLVRSRNIEGDLELDIAYPGGKHRWGV